MSTAGTELRNVYVASLPLTMSDAELLNIFGRYGAVLSAKIMREKHTRQSKGYGFVLFQHDAAAAAAIHAMHGLLVGTSRLQVRLARPDACRDLARQSRAVPCCVAYNASHAPVQSPLQISPSQAVMPGLPWYGGHPPQQPPPGHPPAAP